MRKIYFCLLLTIYSIQVFSYQTTITSSIYANEGNSSPVVNTNTEIQPSIRRVRFVNHIENFPEADIALTAAEYIFSEAMAADVDLVPIEAEVSWGNPTDFDNQDEVCKVDVLYTDDIQPYAYYMLMSQYQNNDIPVLIPQTMYNQCNGTTSGPSMHILLNPNLSYNFTATSTPSDKYDAITIFLRALAIGCGIQSTLNPDTLQFGINRNNQLYVSAFDTRIYNDENHVISDVITQNINISDFLAFHAIYADGYDYVFDDNIDLQHIQLYNDWEIGTLGYNVTANTLNTVNPFGYPENDDEFIDLLDPFLGPGISIREITPFTKALLKGLGWLKTIPVGFNDYAEINNSVLCCNSTTLLPNQDYLVWLTENVNLSNLACKLQSTDSTYSIGNITNPNSFRYSTIPENIQWKRNPVTKNIIGQFEAKAGILINMDYIQQDKVLNIEIPYKPNRPIIQKTENTSNGNITLNLNAFANGSNTYTVTYTGVTYGDTHTFTTTADILDTILTNIPGNQLYNVSLYGTNNEGNSSVCNFTFGFSAHPPLNMTISVIGSILRYDLSSNGTIDISDVVISSVKISDSSGVIWATPNAGSGDPIDISSLSRGFYILTVVADGTPYSRMFIKR